MPQPQQQNEPARATSAVASTEGLRAALAVVAREGWDGPTGTEVLAYARERVVGPALARTGLRGPARAQAEATGWAVAWEVLCRCGEQQVELPWGAVTVAVRRAVAGEVLAADYGTAPRTAWRLRSQGPGAVPRAVSLTALQSAGWEPQARDRGARQVPGPGLSAIIDAMVEAGWERQDVLAVIEWVSARLEQPRDGRRHRRSLAAAAIPYWRARRARVLLVGVPGWPGLLEQVQREGPSVLGRPETLAAVRSTLRVSHLSPASAALRATATGGSRTAACKAS